MKDAVATMGMILPSDAGGKDSVHVACCSCISEKGVLPGQDIRLLRDDNGKLKMSGSDFMVVGGLATDAVGIADPFIRGEIKPGQRFWGFIYPRTITGLVHHWTHPDFPANETAGVYANPNARAEAEAWLENWCKTHDSPNWKRMKEIIENICVEGGMHRYRFGESAFGDEDYYSASIYDDCLSLSGIDGHSDIPNEFWDKAEIAIGRKIKHKPTHFSCSC